MTEITAPKSAVTAEQFADEIREQLKYTQGVTVEQAKPADVYVAASAAVRRHLVDSWMKTQADMVNGNTKAVGYLSAEFLMGKQLENALLNAGLTDQFNKAVKDLGFSAQEIIDAEYEPGLGNGGLGRLAACFIDSLASLGVPAFGYGIQYKYGIFKQEFDENGKQIETPDYWLANEEPWGHIDYNRDQKVSFGGEVVEENGKKVWKPAWSVRAVPVDYMVPGYASGRVNTLRLWTAKSYDEFDLLTFNKSEYLDAVKPQVEAENISKILYPEDSTPQGKALRLEQQYFFVSASIHDAIRVFYPGQDKPDLTTFADKITFQLNDTHPVIGIPELMRVLMDEYGYDWDTAWKITNKTFNYTCHTLLPEALEVWPSKLIGELLPRHLEIIEKINDQFEAELKAKGEKFCDCDACKLVAEILDKKDYLSKKSVWIFGGDGWAYDIGFGGVDHVLAQNKNVNVFVFDTEVYSNTGGQASKASNIGQVAQFAAAGKETKKKSLSEIAMSYGYIYVAQIAMGANPAQTIKAITEAEAYNGPSLIIGYSPCEMHSIKGGMINCQKEMKKAVECGYWNLFRFNPAADKKFTLDSKAPAGGYREFLMNEARYSRLTREFPERAEGLFTRNEDAAKERYEHLTKLIDLYDKQ